MTAGEIVLTLLNRIGIVSFDPDDNASNQNRRGLLAGDVALALRALNGALQECFALGPTALSEKRFADVLRAPLTTTFGVTQFSKTITGLTVWQSYYEGCTIRIAGDPADNELLSAATLLRPYMGPTAAAVGATLYSDTLPVDSMVFKVLEPVNIQGKGKLSPCDNAEDYERHTGCGGGRKPMGIPQHGYAANTYADFAGFSQILLRVAPMPLQACALSYRGKMKPNIFGESDLYHPDSFEDAQVAIPFDWAESTLLPIVLQRFTAHPAFDSPQAIPEIMRQAELAKDQFRASAPPASPRLKAHYR